MSKHRFEMLLALLAVAGTTQAIHAAGSPVRPDEMTPRVARAGAGRPLAAPSAASPMSSLRQYLGARGHAAATLESLRLDGESRRARDGRTHLRLSQEVAGLRVYDSYARATFGPRGELLHVIENLAPVRSRRVARATIDESRALAIALRTLEIPGALPAVAGRSGQVTRFAQAGPFAAAPRVTRVAIPMSDGSLSTGFLVETWQRAGNRLHEVAVAGDGLVLEVLARTNTDSYNVFPVDPATGSQTVVAGAGAPFPWLFPGDHSTVDISGNNVHAYLDTDADNLPDAGGTTVTDGNFLSSFDAAVQPSTATNRNVSVQNLFYLNNLIHDQLREYGFDEAAGNFQEDNFNLGGRGGDPVNAEAQDGSGTDNANFATPRDGQSPRMQMYLWSPAVDHEVVVNSPGSGSYDARGATFGPALDGTGITGDVVLVDDGTPDIHDGCEAPINSLAGKIALVHRGTCAFVLKVANAQAAGAIGVIVANNTTSALITMNGEDPSITIPSVFVSQADGAALESLVGLNATIRLLVPGIPMRDSALDSDIVWHEYGHGLTWRMIGRMSGPLAGAIGEGMGDVLAIVINDDDVVGEYSASDPNGIRTMPYASYPRTYGDIEGTEEHLDGEVYGAIGWRLWQNYQGAMLDRDDLLSDLVDGMNYTRAKPTFESMRDGILASVAGTGRECLVWDAFANYGVGVGAQGRARRNRVIITESFTLPPECSPIP